MNRFDWMIIAASVLGAIACQAGETETAVQAPGPAGPLRGTMLSPGSATAVVLIVPGSGPTDRDGNNPAGIAAAPYRLLAEALVPRGITTVRIDKRGLGGSAGATPDGNAVTIDDYVSDVHAWSAVIRRRTGASCIWLFGHSEGGLVALAAAKNRADICGLMLASTAGRPMGEVLREQLTANSANAPLLDQALSAVSDLEAGKRVDTSNMPRHLLRLFNPLVQTFLISEFSYDPRKLLEGYSKPVLILQGLRDVQVSEVDAKDLKQADPRATLVLLPDVNHVLKSVRSNDLGADLATYSDASLPIAPGVASAISDFLAANTKKRADASP
jgi:hypothetical protein